MVKAVLLINAAATLYMVGLIWFVQVVHYPLFDGVGADGFAEYEDRHARLTTWVVLPPMMIELLTAIWLVVQGPVAVPSWMTWSGLALVVALWVITFAVSVPQHNKLMAGFDASAHRVLVDTNWWRTAAWTVRGGLVIAMLSASMGGSR